MIYKHTHTHTYIYIYWLQDIYLFHACWLITYLSSACSEQGNKVLTELINTSVLLISVQWPTWLIPDCLVKRLFNRNCFIHSDTAEILDKGSKVALILLYLTAVFDVTDYVIFVKVFRDFLWFREKTSSWIEYHSDICHCIFVNGRTSPDVNLYFDIPEGSTLGSKNYCMYIKPIGDIIKHHKIN